MRAELGRIIEEEIRRFLRRQGPRPLMLAEARLDYNVYADRTVLTLILVDGADWHFELPGRGSPTCYMGGDRRLFSRDCVRLYSELYEDHLLEEELRRVGENLRELVISCTDPQVIDAAFRCYRDFETHASRHHQRRRAYPMMPVEPHTDQVASTASNTLTMEHLQRAMQAMRIPPERLAARQVSWGRFRDDLGAFGAAIMGVDYAADVGDPQAQLRALALFKGRLSAAQLAQYEEKQHFDVIGGDTGKRYRIRHGRQMNIDELDAKGSKVCGWCFLPQGGLAAGDVMLAQKIALECDERAALEVANRFAPSSPRTETLTIAEVRRRFVPIDSSGDWMTP